MSEMEAKKAIEGFFEGYNARDDEVIRSTLHYPHVRIGGSGQIRICEKPSDFKAGYEKGWHRSSLDSVEVIEASDNKVHFNITFSRYQTDETRYVTHHSLWIITKINDKWGIIARSSYAP